jgi:hypothetical protein
MNFEGLIHLKKKVMMENKATMTIFETHCSYPLHIRTMKESYKTTHDNNHYIYNNTTTRRPQGEEMMKGCKTTRGKGLFCSLEEEGNNEN